MPRNFNLNQYIDDMAEASSSSSEYSPSQNAKNDHVKDNNDNPSQDDPNKDKEIEEKARHKNRIQNRKHFVKQTIEEDDKQINDILNKNFKRKKRNDDSDNEAKFIVKNKPVTSFTQVTPKAQRMRIGFKKNAHLPPKDFNTQDLVMSPNKEMEALLKYSHEKRIKKKMNEESSDFVKKFEERIKEDDEILQNVIKKNNISQKHDYSDNDNNIKKKKGDKMLFAQKMTLNLKGGFLNMMKEDGINLRENKNGDNDNKQQYKMMTQKQNGGTIHFNNENTNKRYLNSALVDKIESIFK